MVYRVFVVVCLLMVMLYGGTARGQAVYTPTAGKSLGWVNVTDPAYGAKADYVRNVGTGICTSGSATFQDTVNSPFKAGDTGKLITILDGALGNFGTTPFTNAINVTTLTSVASNLQVTFNVGVTSTVPTAGTRVSLNYAATGTLANLPQNSYYYLGTIGGGGPYTATLYYDAALTNPVLYSVTGGASPQTVTGSLYYGPVQFVGTMTYVNATTVTVAPLAGTAGIGLTSTTATYAYGTNNYAAIQKALTALNGTGRLHFPAGSFFADATAAAPYQSPPVVANCIIGLATSNITIEGAGMGATQLIRAGWNGPIIGVLPTAASIANVTVQDMTLSYSQPTGTRYDTQTTNSPCLMAGNATYSITNGLMERIEGSNSSQGFEIAQQCVNCRGVQSVIHDVLSNGLCIVSSITGTLRCGYSGCTVYNTGDSSMSVDCVAGDTLPDTDPYFIDCRSYNSGNYGLELSGCRRPRVISCDFYDCLEAGIAIEDYPGGVATTNGVVITGCKILGSGSGAAQFNSTSTGFCGGIVMVAFTGASTGSLNDILITGNYIGDDGTNAIIGPAIASYFNATCTVNHLQIVNNIFEGGEQLVNTGSYHNNYGTSSGFDITGCVDLQITGNKIRSSYAHGIYVANSCTGPLLIADNNIDTPNTHAAALIYGIDCLGGNAPLIRHNTVTNVGTLAGVLNIAPAGTATVTNTFATLGSIGGQTTTTGGLTWSLLAGTATVASAGILPFSGTTDLLLNPGRQDVHVSCTLGTAPTAAGYLSLLVGANAASTTCVEVDCYNGVVRRNVNSAALTVGTNPPSGWTAQANDIVEALYTSDGFVDVWYTRAGTRTQVNSVFVGRDFTGTYAGLLDPTGHTQNETVTTFNLRY